MKPAPQEALFAVAAEHALRVAQPLEPFDLFFLETPHDFHDPEGYALLHCIATPHLGRALVWEEIEAVQRRRSCRLFFGSRCHFAFPDARVH